MQSRSAPTCSRTATCPRWCSSTPSRGFCPAHSAVPSPACKRASQQSSSAGSSTRTTRGPPSSGLARARRAALGYDKRIDDWRLAQSRLAERPRVRNPIERLGLPHGVTVALDWVVTIVGAVAIVLAIKAWIVNPYRIPTSSMEPRLHCARPGPGCLARFSDRVLANRFIYHFTDPKRGDIVVFNTPPRAAQQCPPAGDLREADHRASRRALGGAGRGRVHQRQEADRAVHRGAEGLQHLRGQEDPGGRVLHDGRQPHAVLRLTCLGDRCRART